MIFANSEPTNFIAGLVVGCMIVGFMWLFHFVHYYIAEHRHESVIDGFYYSTKKAHRVIGTSGNRIADGHWISWMCSLWRTFPANNGERRFFLLHVDEFSPPKLRAISYDDAKKFIHKHASSDDLAEKLIRDFFTSDDRLNNASSGGAC